MKQNKSPLRKCTGCQEMKSKSDLIRVVSNADGEVFFDSTGKKSGRGAYICKNMDCLEKAHKKRGLERSFKKNISKEVYDSLTVELKKLYDK